MNEEVSCPHDRLFRGSMSHPEVALEFLQAHLDREILSKIDLRSISICPGTFVDEELKLSESDVLFKCLAGESKAYIYILAEHQSTQDALMPFRLLKYIIKIWDYHQVSLAKKDALPFPVIFPLVFYTGKGAYKGPKAIWDLCGKESELMQKIFTKPFHLVNVNDASEDELTSRKWAGTMEFFMRYQFRQHIEQEIGKIAENIEELLEENTSFVIRLLSYIMAINDKFRTTNEILSLVQSNLSKEAGGKIMGFAEKLREEGWEEGREEGWEEGKEEGKEEEKIIMAKKMLEANLTSSFIAKITELSLDQIEKLKK